MGAPEFSAPSLKMLINEGYNLAAVVTQPDRPKGRGNKLISPIVKDIALEAGIRVLQPEKPSEIHDELKNLSIDLCVTAAYGCILKKSFLRIPRFGAVNVHASLLPRYRGASPIHQALLNGDAETGVTIMLTEAGVDTGPILMTEKTAISETMYFRELHDKLAEMGAELLKRAIPAYTSGAIYPAPQDGGLATYAPIIQKSDGELDFTLNAAQLVNRVRAFSEWPGATTVIGGKKLKIHKARAVNAADHNSRGIPGAVAGVSREAFSVMCGGHTVLNITRLQFENARAMDISECWHNLVNKR